MPTVTKDFRRRLELLKERKIGGKSCKGELSKIMSASFLDFAKEYRLCLSEKFGKDASSMTDLELDDLTALNTFINSG